MFHRQLAAADPERFGQLSPACRTSDWPRTSAPSCWTTTCKVEPECRLRSRTIPALNRRSLSCSHWPHSTHPQLKFSQWRFFGKFFERGVLGVLRKSQCSPYFRVMLHNYKQVFYFFYFFVGIWSWFADKLHFILSYEAGFYKPTVLKVHPPFRRITAYATMPG
jgi:hypothetical protein